MKKNQPNTFQTKYLLFLIQHKWRIWNLVALYFRLKMTNGSLIFHLFMWIILARRTTAGMICFCSIFFCHSDLLITNDYSTVQAVNSFRHPLAMVQGQYISKTNNIRQTEVTPQVYEPQFPILWYTYHKICRTFWKLLSLFYSTYSMLMISCIDFRFCYFTQT